jgi:hypothetical protein
MSLLPQAHSKNKETTEGEEEGASIKNKRSNSKTNLMKNFMHRPSIITTDLPDFISFQR